jgi:membrane protease YdiL (CAAX protease family)
MPDPQQAFFLMLLAGAIVVVLAGLPVLAIYLSVRPTSLFPRPTGRGIPWNGWAVLLSVVFIFALPQVVQTILDNVGFYQQLYGPEFPSPPAEKDPKSPLAGQAMHLRSLWSGTIAAPFIIALILLGLRYGAGASPAQVGLSRRRSGPNVVLGYLGWLILTPISFGVFILASSTIAPNPTKHPLMDVGPWAGRLELFVFALQAAILMPVLEELFFRGILLPWTVQRKPPAIAIVPPRDRPHVCYVAALLMSLQLQALTEAIHERHWQDLLSASAPALFVTSLLPLYVFLPFSKRVRRRLRISSPHAQRGWLANGILFAAVHSPVWPTPIPLFFLGLGLGWLVLRTQSIIPCIVVHVLFNSIAVVYAIMGGA